MPLLLGMYGSTLILHIATYISLIVALAVLFIGFTLFIVLSFTILVNLKNSLNLKMNDGMYKMYRRQNRDCM